MSSGELHAGRLSLAAVVERLEREGLLRGSTRPRVEQIRGHRQRAWECVFCERRLDGRDPRVDVMGALCERAQGTGWPPGLASGELLADDPVLRRWGIAAAEPDAAAPMLWFEWDMPGGSPRAPLASVCVSNAIVGDLAVRRAPSERGARQRLYGEIAATLLSTGRAPAWREALARVTDALGERNGLLHIAGLLPRGAERLRLAAWVEARTLVPWLRAIGWPGETDDLPAALFRIAPPFQRIGVQIELCPEVGPYLALEAPELRSEEGGRRAPDRLGELGRLAPIADDVVADFARWPGVGELVVDGEATPVLRHAYVKLTREGRGAWSAKGYFGVTTLAMTEHRVRLA